MSNMRQTVTTVTTTNANNHESNLDALLDDLQSSISRTAPPSGINGNVTGYREIRRTITDPNHGGTTTQYHIEYLQPANTTTHIAETSAHHNGAMNSAEFGAPNLSSHKEVSYKYQTSSANKDAGSGDGRLRQNISELDSLLDDLHTAQQNSFSDSNTMVTTRHIGGVDPGLMEPITSTPHAQGPTRTVQERHYREESRIRGRSSSPSSRRELVFTGSRSQDPSPVRHLQEYTGQQHAPPVRQQQIYRYEKTTSTRTTAPTITEVVPIDDGRASPHVTSVRTYSYSPEEPPLALVQHSAPPGHGQPPYYSTRSHSPSPQIVERVEKVTKYTTGKEYQDRRDPSPQRKDGHSEGINWMTRDELEGATNLSGYHTGGKTTHSYSYNSTSKETRPDIPKTPPPHRSPSPVSFPQPPLPNTKTTVKTYHFEQPPQGQSPQPPQKFSPSDPSRTLTYNVSPPHHSVTNYKYTTTTTTSNRYPEDVPLLPRPFPNPSPSPTPEQQPPKKLDELMASFSDTDIQYHTQESSNRRYEPKREATPKSDGRGVDPPSHILHEAKTIEKKEETKNMVGPPVYYPPGELFTKKEETVMQRQAAGGMYKEKSKYEYEASSKSKSKETSGKAVVPVCIPLCCGLPCVIM